MTSHPEKARSRAGAWLRVSAIVSALACVLLTQVGLRFPGGDQGLVIRSFFLASDVVAVLPLIWVEKSCRSQVFLWTSIARAVVALPIVVWLRSTTGGFGDGLFLLGYIPASIVLCITAGVAVAIAVAKCEAKARKVAAHQQVV